MRLAFVGDIALGDHPKAVGFGFRSRYRGGIATTLQARLAPPGATADLLFGNLEFPLGYETADVDDLSQIQCRGSDAYVRSLAAAGVTAVNVATNHSAQHGAEVFQNTVDRLRAAGIHVVGTPDDFTENGVLRVRGHRVAMLGWCDRPRQYSPAEPPYNEFTDSAYDQIVRARRRGDIVVVSIHWGEEFILVPSDRERRIARAMVDAGATLVVGHHPHVLREVEQYRDSVIAYSLGNFVGDMTWDFRNRVTGWLTCTLQGGRVDSWELTPAVIADDYFPRPVVDAAGRRMMEAVASARRSHAARVLHSDYATVAEAERRRHARRTAVMMLRNVFRYPPGTAVELFARALSHRFRAVLR